MSGSLNVRLLKLAALLMVGNILFFSMGAILLLVIALFAPALWPTGITLTTALPGFDLPTLFLYAKLIFIGRMFATLALASLIILPMAGLVLSLDKEGPFASINVRRLRLVAIGCAIYGFGPLLSSVIPLDWKIPLGLLYSYWNWPAAGLTFVALVLAEIFQEGLRLREDADATI